MANLANMIITRVGGDSYFITYGTQVFRVFKEMPHSYLVERRVDDCADWVEVKHVVTLETAFTFIEEEYDNGFNLRSRYASRATDKG